MTAAHVTWRPLGTLLVEKGLLTAEELEEALAVQQTTGKRLGQILVERGHVSGPALTDALAEQYGIELTTEEGFGTGLRAEIERRHTTRRPPAAAEEAVADAPPEAAAETEPIEVNGHSDAALVELEPQLEEHWARLAEAEANLAAREARIAELETELAAARREAEELTGKLQEVATEQDASLVDRERDLAELEQKLAGRQRAVLAAAADLEQRRKALEERERAVPATTEIPEPSRQPQPERPEPAAGSGWSLDALTRLVEESADEFPDRVDEWRYTLFYLRDEASVDGSLPPKFDALVEDCFGELVPALAR